MCMSRLTAASLLLTWPEALKIKKKGPTALDDAARFALDRDMFPRFLLFFQSPRQARQDNHTFVLICLEGHLAHNKGNAKSKAFPTTRSHAGSQHCKVITANPQLTKCIVHSELRRMENISKCKKGGCVSHTSSGAFLSPSLTLCNPASPFGLLPCIIAGNTF